MNGSPFGMLFVASDIDAVHELEFNRWYDEEHLPDRASMAGVIKATRFKSPSDSPKYLALYWAEGISAFDCPEYAQAFKYQSVWSRKMLPLMQNPTRRIGEAFGQFGRPGGEWVAVVAAAEATEPRSLNTLHSALAEIPGYIQSYAISPLPALSLPLPQEAGNPRPMAPMLIVECASESAARQAAESSLIHLPLGSTHFGVYQSLSKDSVGEVR
ncbi:TPA: hypothetical protein QEM85_002874 [Pseudomonas putida]|uniref:DUF4286 family protein n=1 Tax=Pseudomonas putida TaxID=303 RepID=UPI00110D23CF|nr:DUF4286 family protein [Pseudomonas putida]MDD1991430.1 hypothetical protein [Pseudomonas putida]HDS0918876.1 hypothetical protein [Pseudomonas putida]HDS0934421.1 hypothetical protein [Pseudomonas putida]HDS1781464.1 hypothetical protein [Pseudomonas putida]HDS3799501.1 hypothetical protein [Pseudomonas putida]